MVEDSEINRNLLRRRLIRRGFEVEVATDGLAGLQLALELRPDVVLMDMSLPEMDGWQATSRLRAESYEKPIIGLTAHALTEDRERALQSGCDEFITKPVDFEHLVNSIHRLAGASGDAAKPQSEPNPKRELGGPLAVVVAALEAQHAHALNNARMPLLTAIELGDAPDFVGELLRDADETIANLAEEWAVRSRSLNVISSSLFSGRAVALRISEALGVALGPAADTHVRIDLRAFEIAARLLITEPLASTVVSASKQGHHLSPMCVISVGPIGSLPDPKSSAVAALLAQLHIAAHSNPELRTIEFHLPASTEENNL